MTDVVVAKLRKPAMSKDYLFVPVAAFTDGIPGDPTGLAVQFAGMPHGAEPTDTDWVEGSWEPGAATPNARSLIGPGGELELAAGRWDIWMRITGSTEQPVRLVAQLTLV